MEIEETFEALDFKRASDRYKNLVSRIKNNKGRPEWIDSEQWDFTKSLTRIYATKTVIQCFQRLPNGKLLEIDVNTGKHIDALLRLAA